METLKYDLNKIYFTIEANNGENCINVLYNGFMVPALLYKAKDIHELNQKAPHFFDENKWKEFLEANQSGNELSWMYRRALNDLNGDVDQENDGAHIDKSVDGPKHYGGTRCIEEMRALFGDEDVKGFCKCNAFKYRYRAGNKDGQPTERDLAKSEWYVNYLMKMISEQ